MADVEAPPMSTELVNKQRLITGKWFEWFTLRLLGAINAGIKILYATATGSATPPIVVSGAIGTTAFPLSTLGAGLYRITWYLEVTTAEGGSTATVTISFSHNSKALSFTGAALSGAVNTNIQTATVFLRTDQSSPINYAVAYVGALGRYSLDFAVELISAG